MPEEWTPGCHADTERDVPERLAGVRRPDCADVAPLHEHPLDDVRRPRAAQRVSGVEQGKARRSALCNGLRVPLTQLVETHTTPDRFAGLCRIGLVDLVARFARPAGSRATVRGTRIAAVAFVGAAAEGTLKPLREVSCAHAARFLRAMAVLRRVIRWRNQSVTAIASSSPAYLRYSSRAP